MTRQDQKRIVKELVTDVSNKVLTLIADGNIPDSWDGHELREYVAEQFNQRRGNLNRSRKESYNNTILTKGL